MFRLSNPIFPFATTWTALERQALCITSGKIHTYTHLYVILSFPLMFTGGYFDLFKQMPCKTPTSPQHTWYCGRLWLFTSLSVTPKACVVLILENRSACCLFIWAVFNNNMHFDLLEHILPTSKKNQVTHNSSAWDGDFVRIPVKQVQRNEKICSIHTKLCGIMRNRTENNSFSCFKLNPKYPF